MAANNQVKLIVWAKAAGLCSFPDCRKQLIQEPGKDSSIPVGEIAHIVAEQPEGPRGKSPLSQEQRNHPPNLMLLCPTHHTEVDKAPQTYTVDRLREFKRRHEAWVRSTLEKPSFSGQQPISKLSLLTETLHSTVLPVLRVPTQIFMAPPKTFDPEEIRNKSTRSVPYILHNKKIVTFEDLTQSDNTFASITNRRQATRSSALDWWRDPDKYRLYVYLLGRCLNKITGPFGLMFDRKRSRYYFMPCSDGQERREQYRPLNQSVSELSVVWQPIQKSRGEPYGHWLHRAISFRFYLVSDREWMLALRPEFHVTSDGHNDYESSEIGAKVTRKKSRMYNYNILTEVNFWRDYLSRGRPRIVLRFGKQSLVIGTTLVQTEILWPGIPGDTSPFKNVSRTEDLFSFQELEELTDDEWDCEVWEEEEDTDGFF